MNTCLRDVAQVRPGYGFRTRVESEPEGAVHVVQIRDLSGGRLSLADCARIKDDPAQFARHQLFPGDVLVQGRGMRFRAVLFGGLGPAIAALGVFVVRPGPDIHPEYLLWYLNQTRTQSLLSGMSRGAQVPFLPSQQLAALEVAVPPRERQLAIAQVARLHDRVCALDEERARLTQQLVDVVSWRAAVSRK